MFEFISPNRLPSSFPFHEGEFSRGGHRMVTGDDYTASERKYPSLSL